MHRLYIFLLVVILVNLSGCTKDFDTINTDPDRPVEVPPTNVLAFCERFGSYSLFGLTESIYELSTYCGYVSQISYPERSYYSYFSADNDNSWTSLYQLVANLKDIQHNNQSSRNLQAASIILECNVWQIATDRYGDIPYSEACQLDDGIVQPAYDCQKDIYHSLLERLDSACMMLSPDGGEIGCGDLMLGGDILKWRCYATSLCLRMAARIACADPTLSQAVFSKVLSHPDRYPLPESNLQNVFFDSWGREYGDPWAALYAVRSQDVGISKLIVDILKSLDDPRLPVYADPTPNYLAGISTDPYVGHPIGLETTANTSACSLIGERFTHKSNQSGFSPWLRSCEPYFAIAYAASKGFETQGFTQQSAYEKAVSLSLDENGLSSNEIDDYLTQGGSYNGTLEQLVTQWWISLFKNPDEGWSLFRMTGMPVGIVIAPCSVYHKNQHNTVPMALPYPDTEANLNHDHYSQHAGVEVDHYWGKQMWWDTRTGIY
ncbi:MAG: SusD/RagB family nutrient-binding outer membrane lipoprotein [Bacteroidales bacterium]|nr:SusD/RagB family nutrient-binding outer membrane lipoprotein [Candidatus Colimorpha onthohippi]